MGAHVYTPSTASAGRTDPPSFPAYENQFNNLSDGYGLRITPTTELDSTGGVRDLDLTLNSANIECNNCGSYRNITAGQLVGITDDIFGDGFD